MIRHQCLGICLILHVLWINSRENWRTNNSIVLYALVSLINAWEHSYLKSHTLPLANSQHFSRKSFASNLIAFPFDVISQSSGLVSVEQSRAVHSRWVCLPMSTLWTLIERQEFLGTISDWILTIVGSLAETNSSREQLQRCTLSSFSVLSTPSVLPIIFLGHGYREHLGSDTAILYSRGLWHDRSCFMRCGLPRARQLKLHQNDQA